MRNTRLPILMLLVIGATTWIALPTSAFILGENWSAPNDTFDSQLQPEEAMTLDNCNFIDSKVSILNYLDAQGFQHHGERRRFTNTRSGASGTADHDAYTSVIYPLKTKRTRSGTTIGTTSYAKLRYTYKVFGRNDNGDYLNPQTYVADGCGTIYPIAQYCSEIVNCPYGYTSSSTESICECSQPESPIILNLSGGQNFDISTAENGIQFDLNTDGRLERIASPLDADVVGFLYLENGGGHDGHNLFGNLSPQPKVAGLTPNGFLALRGWDDPQVGKDATGKLAVIGPPDGRITPSDGVWKNLLRVWFDLNRNGLADNGEKKTLDELGIVALETDYQVVNRLDNNGNAIKMLGKFWKKNDPKPYFMVDYWAATINP